LKQKPAVAVSQGRNDGRPGSGRERALAIAYLLRTMAPVRQERLSQAPTDGIEVQLDFVGPGPDRPSRRCSGQRRLRTPGNPDTSPAARDSPMLVSASTIISRREGSHRDRPPASGLRPPMHAADSPVSGANTPWWSTDRPGSLDSGKHDTRRKGRVGRRRSKGPHTAREAHRGSPKRAATVPYAGPV